jgi:hypothetical protein
MGLLLSRAFRKGLIFFIVSFFVRLGSPFLRPDPLFSIVGARSCCQGWPSLGPCLTLYLCQATP